MNIITRFLNPYAQQALEVAGIHPLLARLYSARGVLEPSEVNTNLSYLLSPDTLKGTTESSDLLIDALENKRKICIIADYDCDGATACSVALRGLVMLGFTKEQLNYIVPNRVVDGYGLTPDLANRAKSLGTDLLITVDNGISSMAGVDHAKQVGMKVIITDHHLPALIDGKLVVPNAHAIVNPNQPGCEFKSKDIAGVGVIFYVLLALRTKMRTLGYFTENEQPKLNKLLDLVALGTVADVVRLDANNRRLVEHGLIRIRRGQMQQGVRSLFEVATRDPSSACTSDIGFALGPRLNAAGRMADMSMGISCLLADDPEKSREFAQALCNVNDTRKEVEAEMLEKSIPTLEKYLTENDEVISDKQLPKAMILYDPDFHEGVIGILASRLKEKFYRPSFVFALASVEGEDKLIKGSGRSINGLHLRDALDLVEKKHPGLIVKFGGHAMAAGCTLREKDLKQFSSVFESVVDELIDEASLNRSIVTDGDLPKKFCNIETADLLRYGIWGSGFESPIFSEKMEVVSQRIVGDKHLSMTVRLHGKNLAGIWFGRTSEVPDTATFAFQLEVNEWLGDRNLQLLFRGIDLTGT